MEDDAAARRRRLPHRRRGGRCRRAGGHQNRHRALMALRPAHALHRLGLPSGGGAPSPPRGGGEPFLLFLGARAHRQGGGKGGSPGRGRPDENGKPSAALILEHYPGMAEAEIARHVEEARARWPLVGVTVIHRHGRLTPGEVIVLVVTASSHREAAFAAAAFLMDY